MPRIEFTRRFTKSYGDLPKAIQQKVQKAIALLAKDPRHPSLQAKPIQGAKGIYEARVDINHRLTCERLPGDILHLRALGDHDDTLKNP